MRDWAQANGHRPIARKQDWDAEFRVWIGREADRVAQRSPPQRESTDAMVERLYGRAANSPSHSDEMVKRLFGSTDQSAHPGLDPRSSQLAQPKVDRFSDRQSPLRRSRGNNRVGLATELLEQLRGAGKVIDAEPVAAS